MALSPITPRPNPHRNALPMVTAVQRRIVGYHQDAERHWVAELECGHDQHVRHQPPWTYRPWVVSPAGRARHLGALLQCRKCERGIAPDRAA